MAAETWDENPAKKNCEIPQCFASYFFWLSSRSSKDRKLTNEFRKEVKPPEYICIIYSTEHKQFLLTTATVFVLITHRIAFYSRDMEGPKDLKKACFAQPSSQQKLFPGSKVIQNKCFLLQPKAGCGSLAPKN